GGTAESLGDDGPVHEVLWLRRQGSARHVARIEGELDVPPEFILLCGEIVWRAAEHRPDGAFRRRAGIAPGRRLHNFRYARNRAVLVELYPDHRTHLRRIGPADRRAPALRQPLAQRVELAL